MVDPPRHEPGRDSQGRLGRMVDLVGQSSRPGSSPACASRQGSQDDPEEKGSKPCKVPEACANPGQVAITGKPTSTCAAWTSCPTAHPAQASPREDEPPIDTSLSPLLIPSDGTNRQCNGHFPGKERNGDGRRSAERGRLGPAGARKVSALMTRVRLTRPARSQASQSRKSAGHGHFDTGQEDCQV